MAVALSLLRKPPGAGLLLLPLPADLLQNPEQLLPPDRLQQIILNAVADRAFGIFKIIIAA
ncbi:hypothetical protein D3C81_2105470 [compost metagenome]